MLYAGNIGTNDEDVELCRTRALGHAACDFLLTSLNRCVICISEDDSCDVDAAGTCDTDICVSMWYSCDCGVTWAGTPLGLDVEILL